MPHLRGSAPARRGRSLRRVVLYACPGVAVAVLPLHVFLIPVVALVVAATAGAAAKLFQVAPLRAVLRRPRGILVNLLVVQVLGQLAVERRRARVRSCSSVSSTSTCVALVVAVVRLEDVVSACTAAAATATATACGTRACGCRSRAAPPRRHWWRKGGACALMPVQVEDLHAELLRAHA